MPALWTAVSLAAQEPVRPNLDGFKYPVIPRSARIQGTVKFVVKSEGIQLVSGNPMLVAAAKSNLEKWAVPHVSDMPLSVTYIFRFADREFVEVDEPIGDRLDRFFLRLLGRPVTRRVTEEVCPVPKVRPTTYKNEMKDGIQSIEICIEAPSSCFNTDVAAIASVITVRR